MNTQFFGWTFPDAHETPWYDKFAGFARAVDLTVYSLSQAAPPRFTCAVSWYPGGIPGTTIISSATDTNYGGVGDGRWTVLSAAPYGRAVGSFSVQCSGGQVLLMLQTGAFISSAVPLTSNGGSLRVRAVIRGGPGGSVQSLAFPTNSVWFQKFSISEVIFDKTHVAVGSLGPGAYSAELQVRYRDVTGTGSSCSINAFTPFVLHTIDGAPGR